MNYLTSGKRGETLTSNPNECNSTLTSGTKVFTPTPIDVNDRGHRLRIILARLRMLVETDGYAVALLIHFHVIGHQSKYIYRVLSGIFRLVGGGGGGVNPKQIFPATQ